MDKSSLVTTKCCNYGHKDFVLEFDSTILEVDVAALASFCEEAVATGTRFESGELIEFGSMLLRIAIADNYFTVQEPDMQSIPIKWTPGVTQSMKLLRLQKDITESVGVEGEIEPPPIRHSLLVGTDVTEDDDDFVLERMNPIDADSGWFVGRPDTLLDYNCDANLNRLSVYEAIVRWPTIGGFLALPAGCRVHKRGATSFLFARDGEPLTVKRGSFLDTLSSQPSFGRFDARAFGPR